MARRSDPDYVSGKRGRYELAPRITHPPHCLCEVCPRHRATAEDWARSITIRTRRLSPYRFDRLRSAIESKRLQETTEAALIEAVKRAEEERRAMGLAVRFGAVCDTYRDFQRREGKRLDRDQYRINAIESYFGRDRDA